MRLVRTAMRRSLFIACFSSARSQHGAIRTAKGRSNFGSMAGVRFAVETPSTGEAGNGAERDDIPPELALPSHTGWDRSATRSRRSTRGMPHRVLGRSLISPASEAATPIIPRRLRHRQPEEREWSAVPPSSSRLDQPDSDDALRRVAVLVYQHVCRGERSLRGAREGLAVDPSPSMTPDLSFSNPASLLSPLSLQGNPGPRPTTGHEPEPPTSTADESSSWWQCLWPQTNDTSGPREPLLSDTRRRRSSSSGWSSDDDGILEQREAEREAKWGPDDPYAGIPHDTLQFHEREFEVPQYELEFSAMPTLAAPASPVVRRIQRYYPVPSVEEVYRFAKYMYDKAQLSPECSIVSLIYVERLMEKASVYLLGCTWRPILLCGLLLASKVWQDLSTWNAEFCAIFGEFPLNCINKLERRLVSSLRFELFIPSSVYARYYFALRSMGEQRNFRRRFLGLVSVAHPPQAQSQRIEDRSKDLRSALYSRSL